MKINAGVFFIFSILHWSKSDAALILTEVAYAGGGGQCGGSDWVEILNDGTADVSLVGYTLHDDKGADDDKAKTFTGTDANTNITPGEYKLLCKGDDFNFGIGSDDTVTLVDGNGTLLSTSGALPDGGGDEETYAYFPNGSAGEYKYTATPTPGAANIFTTYAETLRVRNDASKDFFRMDDDGSQKTSSSFPEVVDIHVSMDAKELAYIIETVHYEEYGRFTEIHIVDTNSNTTIDSGGEGKIRPKGQSSLMYPVCFGAPSVPYQIKMDTPLYGMKTFYLRNHLVDNSYMREYAIHRLNARFGLPHTRSRAAQLFFNGEYIGFYTLMEAPDEPYVVQRSLGSYIPNKTALYKVKTLSGRCPDFYSEEQLAAAEARDTPDPYYFKRGEHRDPIPVLNDDYGCDAFFNGQIGKDENDIIKGYVENNRNCAEAMVNLGRIDRDIGPSSIDEVMISLLDKTIYSGDVEKSMLKEAVDADQWMQNFAAYSVTVGMDSPIGNLNNWYIGSTTGGTDNDWRIVQYDHNLQLTSASASLCHPSCSPRMIYWPILRPTCLPVEDHVVVGPILNSTESSQVYLNFVEEFIGLLSPAFFAEMREHGMLIKDYAVQDSLSEYGSASVYEAVELSPGIDGYKAPTNPFLKVLGARKIEVEKQLQAIKEDSLPRNGEYGRNEVCPDWRDANGDNYILRGTVLPGCEGCADAGGCYDYFCSADGKSFVIPECDGVPRFFCDQCFPYSRCGTLEDVSNVFEENDKCNADSLGPDYESCRSAAGCFDHTSGDCAFDGEILNVDCVAEGAEFCKPCFPNSRCSKGVETPKPTAMPTAKKSTECIDSPLPMKLNGRKRMCGFAKKNQTIRCAKRGVASHCPLTCDGYLSSDGVTQNTCDEFANTDTQKRFYPGKTSRTKACAWVKRAPELLEKRCQKKGVAGTCRDTCSDYL